MENKLNVNYQGAYITGRLTRVAEVLKSKDGREFLKTTIAINHGKDEADFIELLTSGKAGEVLMGLDKGQMISAKGRLRLNSYVGKDNEQKAKIQFSAGVIYPVVKENKLEAK